MTNYDTLVEVVCMEDIIVIKYMVTKMTIDPNGTIATRPKPDLCPRAQVTMRVEGLLLKFSVIPIFCFPNGFCKCFLFDASALGCSSYHRTVTTVLEPPPTETSPALAKLCFVAIKKIAVHS